MKIKLKDYEYDALYDPIAEKFFEDIDELYDDYEEIGEPIPKYVHGCLPIQFKINIGEVIIEELENNHYEDAARDIEYSEIQKLQNFIDEWCNKQNINTLYCNKDLIIELD